MNHTFTAKEKPQEVEAFQWRSDIPLHELPKQITKMSIPVLKYNVLSEGYYLTIGQREEEYRVMDTDYTVIDKDSNISVFREQEFHEKYDTLNTSNPEYEWVEGEEKENKDVNSLIKHKSEDVEIKSPLYRAFNHKDNQWEYEYGWKKLSKGEGGNRGYFHKQHQIRMFRGNGVSSLCDPATVGRASSLKADQIVFSDTVSEENQKYETYIFEGDIVQFESQFSGAVTGQVTYSDRNGFLILATNGKSYHLIKDGYPHTKIGNIYENPEIVFGSKWKDASIGR